MILNSFYSLSWKWSLFSSLTTKRVVEKLLLMTDLGTFSVLRITQNSTPRIHYISTAMYVCHLEKKAAFSKCKICLCGTHPLHTDLGGNYISLYVRLHSFKDTSASQSVFVYFSAKKLHLYICLWMSIQMTPSVLLPFKPQACTWAFCKGIPCYLSMRHRFTVAGNNERLFYSPLCYFHLQNCYIKCAWKPTQTSVWNRKRETLLLYNQLY